MDTESEIPWERFAAFVRQHTHDVRNGLNSLDLEMALLHELVAEGEGRACIDRVRSQVRALGGQMRSLSALFQEPKPSAAPLAAQEVFHIWNEQQAGLPAPLEVKWVNELGEEQVSVDAGMIATVFRELLANAAAFSEGSTVTASARRAGGDVLFELSEPKRSALDTTAWGRPLATKRRGGYGLGLWSVRRLLDANHARFAQAYLPDEGVLLSRISFPICK